MDKKTLNLNCEKVFSQLQETSYCFELSLTHHQQRFIHL